MLRVLILWHFTRCGEFSKGLLCLSIETKLYTYRNSNRGTVKKNSSTISSSGRNRTYACAMPVHCSKIKMIYPQPIRRHYLPKMHINYACSHQLPPYSLVVRAVHRHRTGVGSIPAGRPYS